MLGYNVVFHTYEARKIKGLTLEELSQLTGLSRSHLNRIEKNMTDPKFGEVLKIAVALQMLPEKLFTITSYFL